MLVLETAHDRELLLERLERSQDRHELEALAVGRRRPLAHDGAVRKVDEPELYERLLRRVRERGHHRIEHRQRDRRADSTQHRPPRQMLLGDEHLLLLLSAQRVAAACVSRSPSALGLVL
jgi:hypothetical protein